VPRISGSDVLVIGAGPVGCATALAFAGRGAAVRVLEANPRGAERLAGEWLHPPALAMLRELGVEPRVEGAHADGEGFVVYPDDGRPPISLSYPDGALGMSCEHDALVGLLRERIAAHPRIEFLPFARVIAVEGQSVTFRPRDAAERTVQVDLIVGAGGRQSVAHRCLGLPCTGATFSRMAGLILKEARLPHEGFGHVFLGGPGPALAYRLSPTSVRLCLDVPLSRPLGPDAAADLWDAFHGVLPPALREAFRSALRDRPIAWASNQLRPRVSYGREGLALVGDSVGCYHPLTALGMTLGFQDAAALARSGSFEGYRQERIRRSRVQEMLAVALYEVFADTSPEVVSIRRAIYNLWRDSPLERRRTMGFLAGLDRNPARFASAFLRTLTRAGWGLAREGMENRRWRGTGGAVGQLATRARWLLTGTLGRKVAGPSREVPRTAEDRFGGLLRASLPGAPGDARPERRPSPLASVHETLVRGARHLRGLQNPDGSWEGEVSWCPMLAAQYVMTCWITGTPIAPERRERILMHFRATRLPSGVWGLHEASRPYLFVTTLVYVASRLLGLAADDPLLAPARRMFEAEGGVIGIPTWGKFWLALLGLYPWEGMNAIPPELWALPRWVPVHPSRFYCHTRNIYLSMAVLHGSRVTAADSPVLRALREELHPGGYDRIEPAAARAALREGDLHAPPGAVLRWTQAILSRLDRLRAPEHRGGLLAELREHIRFELRSTGHASISPVSGLLNWIALWWEDPADPDASLAAARLEEWIWEDDEHGTRVAGARSASWDTAFAMQALVDAEPVLGDDPALAAGDAFLASQQIRRGVAQPRFFRGDPSGGYCFGHARHGWPVSDCTAEALVARLSRPGQAVAPEAVRAGVRFLLSCQNHDGGFGSYESSRIRLPLEWMNPAEMFGDSMKEGSYVECTASSLAALAAVRRRMPGILPDVIETSIARARRWLLRAQRTDGSWEGAWGIHFVYGTLFGIRGLLGSGLPAHHPRVRRACSWLRARQRPDGGWGEHFEGCRSGDYTEADHSQVIQTAWAVTALLEARDPDWAAIRRGTEHLAAAQRPDGSWPRQEPAGIFFRTAVLDYALYRAYFPVRALALFEQRRAERADLRPARASSSRRVREQAASP
jgi:lanosterol synthase